MIYLLQSCSRNYVLLFSACLFSGLSVFSQVDSSVNYRDKLVTDHYDTQDTFPIPEFTYQSASDPRLAALRKSWKLDSIAGGGNELSKMINILHWLHNTIRHDGQHDLGVHELNAVNIRNTTRRKHMGAACGELVTVLNECYLAMGWPSRKIFCFPKKDTTRADYDSHVIDVVYWTDKHKWIWMDPTNDAYVMDEKGEPLSIGEVRSRIISGKPLIVNPDANWNHISSTTKDYYLDAYMTKNLYLLFCPLRSEYNYETTGQNRHVTYVYLKPRSGDIPIEHETKPWFNAQAKTTFVTYTTQNPDLFWRIPASAIK